MKKIFFYSSIGTVMFLILTAFSIDTEKNKSSSNYSEQEKTIPGFPENVNNIIQNHCYGCHNNDSKSEDAVKELNFDEWENYSLMKKTGKLNDICKIISEGKMPPEKFLKKYPDKKLNDEQIKIICGWINRRQKEKL